MIGKWAWVLVGMGRVGVAGLVPEGLWADLGYRC